MNTVLGMLLATLVASADGPREQREFTETYQVPIGAQTTLEINNIWGDIRVTGHDSEQLEIKVRELRSAPDDERMQLSRELLSVQITETEERIEFSLPHRYRNGYKDPERDALWQRCQRCRLELDYEINLPRGMSVSLSTVNNGQIRLREVDGSIHARNVNGDVTLEAIRHCEAVETVNGDVQIMYAETPLNACQIETVNGDITLGLPPGSNLDLGLQMGNGQIRSEHNVSQISLPADREKRQTDHGTQFRLRQWTGLRLGQGGTLHTIESMNGDVELIEL